MESRRAMKSRVSSIDPVDSLQKSSLFCTGPLKSLFYYKEEKKLIALNGNDKKNSLDVSPNSKNRKISAMQIEYKYEVRIMQKVIHRNIEQYQPLDGYFFSCYFSSH